MFLVMEWKQWNGPFQRYKNAFGNASNWESMPGTESWNHDEGLGLCVSDTFNYTDFVVNDHDFNFGFSIRCLKDAE